MEINADFSKRAIVHAMTLPWVPSPIAGVDRRMLDRIGDEVARATSLVRYAPNSKFSAHVHGGGEEFLVIEGVFSDEHGDFPVGSYIRNPPTTRHTPRSAPGCVIFVKLWQFDPDDRHQLRIATAGLKYTPVPGRRGVSAIDLFADNREQVRLEHWEPETDVHLDTDGGIELLVTEGSMIEGNATLTEQSWLRLPSGKALSALSGPNGAKIWIKTGHLTPPVRIPYAA